MRSGTRFSCEHGPSCKPPYKGCIRLQFIILNTHPLHFPLRSVSFSLILWFRICDSIHIYCNVVRIRQPSNNRCRGRSQGDVRAAMDCYNKAISLDDGSPHAYKNRGFLHLRMGDFAKARGLPPRPYVAYKALKNKRHFAYKALNNMDTLHVKHYVIRTLCMYSVLFSALRRICRLFSYMHTFAGHRRPHEGGGAVRQRG